MPLRLRDVFTRRGDSLGSVEEIRIVSQETQGPMLGDQQKVVEVVVRFHFVQHSVRLAFEDRQDENWSIRGR